jgi:DNA-binding NarL/FixJ family response regulator
MNEASEMKMTQKLSEREIEVLRLLAVGYNNRTIAEELKISRRTVETHRAKMRMRMQMDSEELIEYAKREGLVAENGRGQKGSSAISLGMLEAESPDRQ